MNGVDYTKQLAKERDFYQDSIQKNKQATDKRISDVEKQLPTNLEELRKIYAMTLLEKVPQGYSRIQFNSSWLDILQLVGNNQQFSP